MGLVCNILVLDMCFSNFSLDMLTFKAYNRTSIILSPRDRQPVIKFERL